MIFWYAFRMYNNVLGGGFCVFLKLIVRTKFTGKVLFIAITENLKRENDEEDFGVAL